MKNPNPFWVGVKYFRNHGGSIQRPLDALDFVGFHGVALVDVVVVADAQAALVAAADFLGVVFPALQALPEWSSLTASSRKIYNAGSGFSFTE